MRIAVLGWVAAAASLCAVAVLIARPPPDPFAVPSVANSMQPQLGSVSAVCVEAPPEVRPAVEDALRAGGINVVEPMAGALPAGADGTVAVTVRNTPLTVAPGRHLLHVDTLFFRDVLVNVRGVPVRTLTPVWVRTQSAVGDEKGVRDGTAKVATDQVKAFVEAVRVADGTP